MLIRGASDPCSTGAQLVLTSLYAGYRVIATCRAPIDRIWWFEEKGCPVIELDVGGGGSTEDAAGQLERINSVMHDCPGPFVLASALFGCSELPFSSPLNGILSFFREGKRCPLVAVQRLSTAQSSLSKPEVRRYSW